MNWKEQDIYIVSMNVEYLFIESRFFFTSTFAAQFVENYYYKDEKSSNQWKQDCESCPNKS